MKLWNNRNNQELLSRHLLLVGAVTAQESYGDGIGSGLPRSRQPPQSLCWKMDIRSLGGSFSSSIPKSSLAAEVEQRERAYLAASHRIIYGSSALALGMPPSNN